jgi:small subunit ribosomal protein S6
MYDLMLLLSTTAPEEQRAKILGDVERDINAAGGSIERNADWGTRPLAYQINHQADAEYHMLQFEAPPSMLENLSHNLRINDGVLRHRIIKVLPGTPPAPESAPPVIAAAHASAPAEPEEHE